MVVDVSFVDVVVVVIVAAADIVKDLMSVAQELLMFFTFLRSGLSVNPNVGALGLGVRLQVLSHLGPIS